MNPTTGRSLIQDTKGAAALEFALVIGLLLALLLGGFEAGIMLWTRGTLQTVAAQTARCAAIGSCSDPKSYAVAHATNWLGSALVTAGDLTVTTASACLAEPSGTTTFQVVTISVTPWAGAISYPFGNRTETVTACFPI